MKTSLRKKLLLKALAGVLCFMLAIGGTIVVRDVLAMQRPDLAIPTLRVNYYLTHLPDEHIVSAAYSWRFLLWAKEDAIPREEWAEDTPVYGAVRPEAPMQLELSYPCKNFMVSISRDGGDFVPMALVDSDEEAGPLSISRDGYFLSPSELGYYIYRVECFWGLRGSVMYYIKVYVPNIND